MTRAEVHQVLGKPQRSGREEREAFLGGFFVHYDSAGRVEFVELARSPDFRAQFHGVCLHEVLAEEAVELVEEYDEFDETQPEPGYMYIFLDLQLSLWRGTCPEPGQPESDPDGRYFEAVGVAATGYFKPGE
ncbi:MAG: hypothetical protein QM765_04205 [Myxococcales bacterium]